MRININFQEQVIAKLVTYISLHKVFSSAWRTKMCWKKRWKLPSIIKNWFLSP